MHTEIKYPSIQWYRHQAQYRRWYEQSVWAMLAHLGRPSSFGHFGCGDGWSVRTARMAGCNPAIGVETSHEIKLLVPKWARIAVHDMDQPLDLQWQFEMLLVTRQGNNPTTTYLENIEKHSLHWLVFATMERMSHEWSEAFEARQFIYCDVETMRMRDTLRWVTGPLFWLPQNVMVYRR